MTNSESAVVQAADLAPVQVNLTPELLLAYKRMLAYQFIGALILIAMLAAGLTLSLFIDENWKPSLLILVTMSGMLGAFFSALMRLYNVDQLSVALVTPTIRNLEGRYLLMYSLVPVVVGGVAAVVLYIAFMSGLVAGDIFPEMDCDDGMKCNRLYEVVKNYGPQSAANYGKALLWSFIAGFSERFVPDTLQSLVAKSQKDASG